MSEDQAAALVPSDAVANRLAHVAAAERIMPMEFALRDTGRGLSTQRDDGAALAREGSAAGTRGNNPRETR